MISVIIPYMYKTGWMYHQWLERCLDSLSKQTAKPQIIISQHDEERYIKKNYLLNEGLKRASGDVIWHCDADFELEDETVLERMEKELKEVIYPVFYSKLYKKMKIADGGLMIKKSVLDRHGPLDENLIGIGYVTFPILKWCMDNTQFDVREDFVVSHNGKGGIPKAHRETKMGLKELYAEVIEREQYKMFDMR